MILLKRKTITTNCLELIKLYCTKIDLEITEAQWENAKIIIGNNDNYIIGIEFN